VLKVLYKKIKLWWLKEKIIKSWLEGEEEVLKMCQMYLSESENEIVSLIQSCTLVEKDDFKAAADVIEACSFEGDEVLGGYSSNLKKLLEILNV
jgi:hypothetical protein